MSYFKTPDQTEIFYKDMGQGAPVILIHGWPLTSDMWEYQSLALVESGFRVIAYDRRGFGKSSQPAQGYDYDTLAADLNGLIDHLKLSSVKLVGFSMGGGEIARYLAKFGPEAVAKAVLVSSVVPYMLKTTDNPNGVSAEQFNEMKRGLKDDRPKFLGSFNKTFYGGNLIHSAVSEETQEWSSIMAYQASLKAALDCVDAFGRTDFRKDTSAFTMPTLIIHGTADKTVPIEIAGQQAAKMIKTSIFKSYEGAPHGLFITHKNQLNEDLVSFLK